MSTVGRSFLFMVFTVSAFVYDVSSDKKSKTHRNNVDDELFPIYECGDRTRDWTRRCLVPLTNAQLSLDLCGTREKPDQAFLNRCAKELQILGQSCPQTMPVSEIAKDLQVHKPPPAPYSSPNMPKTPPRTEGMNKKDKLSL